MSIELSSEKLSIKNLLFSKAIPNYVIPVSTMGHKVYSCTDCGDKYIFESSYNYHINRQSVMIHYMCRHCSQMKIFYNRCNLLSHIRSHAFKTATINVTDLKVEPLPLNHYKLPLRSVSSRTSSVADKNVICPDCKETLTGPGPAYKDRARHFMQFTNEVYTCPVCLFALPTECGLKVHMRLHFKRPPYFCPECGCQIPNQNVNYPYNHDCEGFRMMRATSRLKCQIDKCPVFHPNELKDHMHKKHSKKVFKCPFCVVACFNELTMRAHLTTHKTDSKALIFYQCEICPGRLVLQSQMDNHLRKHPIIKVFPCWTCSLKFKDITSLINHCIKKHNDTNSVLGKLYHNILNETFSATNKNLTDKVKRIYRVVKKCDQCHKSFTYKCKYNEIKNLPDECPYKCSPNSLYKVLPVEGNDENVSQQITDDATKIICHLCKLPMSQSWTEIKKHYSNSHTDHKCLDIKCILTKFDISKYVKPNIMNRSNKNKLRKTIKRVKRRGKNKILNSLKTLSLITTSHGTNEDFVCNICKEKCENKALLEQHMISHRDPYMAYQCLECGQSFIVKTSFSTHLLIVHQINNTDEYIKNKKCYNENAFQACQQKDQINEEPLRENQCNICMEQFEDSEDLKKHFRVHGMAFLLKSTSNKGNES